MIAEVARYLHQSIDEVEEWPDVRFIRYHSKISQILEAEMPQQN